MSSLVKNMSANRMSIELVTTASVLAFPTSMEPPSTVYPLYEATLVMMNAYTMALIMPHQKNQGVNSNLNPTISSCMVVVPNSEVANAPIKPAATLKVTSIGMMVISPNILGNIR